MVQKGGGGGGFGHVKMLFLSFYNMTHNNIYMAEGDVLFSSFDGGV